MLRLLLMRLTVSAGVAMALASAHAEAEEPSSEVGGEAAGAAPELPASEGEGEAETEGEGETEGEAEGEGEGETETEAEIGAGAESAGDAFYDAIDAATVRVFAVGTVGVETFSRGIRKVRFAVPNAGHGTGFAVGGEGLVLTAHHVVADARHVVVRLPGEGGFYPARVVFSDEERDVAVLDVNASLASLEALDGVPLRVRQSVYALGYPMDPSRVHPQSARGIVAGRVDDDTLQLDMTLNPGNSGGPLLDEDNRVVGMVVARGDVDRGVQGIGFAVERRALAAAAQEAKRRIDAGQVAPIAPDAGLSAIVVDELLQKGALHELHEAADLEEGLQSADLERTLDELSSRIDDSDLLAFVAGVLWNAAIAIDVLGVREIGEATLSDEQAGQLASRLRSTSIAVAERAQELDPSVSERSAFVRLAAEAGPRKEHPRTEPHPQPDLLVDVGLRISPELRVNPSTTRVGGGVAVGASLSPRKLVFERGATFVPVVGVAFGTAALDGPRQDERFRHSFVAAELGLSAQFGERDRHIELLAAYAPSYYTSTVFIDGGNFGAASEPAWLHLRLAAGLRYRALYVGTGARVLSGPTFWFEPLSVGFVMSL